MKKISKGISLHSLKSVFKWPINLKKGYIQMTVIMPIKVTIWNNLPPFRLAKIETTPWWPEWVGGTIFRTCQHQLKYKMHSDLAISVLEFHCTAPQSATVNVNKCQCLPTGNGRIACYSMWRTLKIEFDLKEFSKGFKKECV